MMLSIPVHPMQQIKHRLCTIKTGKMENRTHQTLEIKDTVIKTPGSKKNSQHPIKTMKNHPYPLYSPEYLKEALEGCDVLSETLVL